MYLILDENTPRAQQSIAYLKKQGVEAVIAQQAKERYHEVEIIIIFSETSPAEIAAWKERTGALAVYCTREYNVDAVRSIMMSSLHEGTIGYNGVVAFPPEVEDLKTWLTEKETPRVAAPKAYTEAIAKRSYKSELPTPRTRIWTVVGTKGGVGKSTMSTLLANALVKAGHTPVVVVELDNNEALCKMNQVQPVVTLDAFERLPDYMPNERIEQNMVWVPNLRWWLVPNSGGAEVSNDALFRLLNTVGNYAGELIFDCPVNPHSRARALALKIADQVVIVGEPSNANLINIRELLAETKQHTVVLNRILDYQKKRANAIAKQIRVTDTVNVELIGHDRILDERVNHGMTIFGNKETEAVIRRVAGLEKETVKRKGWLFR